MQLIHIICYQSRPQKKQNLRNFTIHQLLKKLKLSKGMGSHALGDSNFQLIIIMVVGGVAVIQPPLIALQC